MSPAARQAVEAIKAATAALNILAYGQISIPAQSDEVVAEVAAAFGSAATTLLYDESKSPTVIVAAMFHVGTTYVSYAGERRPATPLDIERAKADPVFGHLTRGAA